MVEQPPPWEEVSSTTHIPSWYQRTGNFLFVIGGPSGSGKSLLVRYLQFEKAPRETTRPPRRVKDPWDIHVTPEQFTQRKAEGRYVYSYNIPHILDVKGTPSEYGFSRRILDRLHSEDLVLMVGHAGNVENLVTAFKAEGARVVPILIISDEPVDLEMRLKFRLSSPEDRKRRLAEMREEYNQHWTLATGQSPVYAHMVINPNSQRLRKDGLLDNSPQTMQRIWGETSSLLGGVIRSVQQIITFYQFVDGVVKDYASQTILRAYADACSLHLFGESLDEILTRFRKQGHLEFEQPHTIIGNYLRERYIITNVKVSNEGRMIFSIGMRKSPTRRVMRFDSDLFDKYLCEFFYFPLTLSEQPQRHLRIDPQTKNRVFTLGDYHAPSTGYTGIELEYQALQKR